MPTPTEEEVIGYMKSLSNWGRWGPDDRLGTLNLVTPAKRAEAAALVREGMPISAAWDIETRTRPGQDVAPHRFMVATGEGIGDPDRVPTPGLTTERMASAAEYIGLVYHGLWVTHVDGLSHIFWDKKMYNGLAAEKVTAGQGATQHDITALADGVVTRGVLLDLAAHRGKDWLEPGEAVFPDDLEAAEERAGVRVGEGDALLLRTGFDRRKRQQGSDAIRAGGMPGFHAACLPWLRQRGVAVVGADTAQDVFPSSYAALGLPIHVVGIVAMGLWLVDNCNLERLAQHASEVGRWEFLFMLAPLRMRGGTGSPANPLAVF